RPPAPPPPPPGTSPPRSPAAVAPPAAPGRPPPAGLAAAERRAFEQLIRTFNQVEYAKMMAARPQTLYGIADSPVGLAAWLLDHNDADGQPAAAVAAALKRTESATGELTRDEILDNITLYSPPLRPTARGAPRAPPLLGVQRRFLRCEGRRDPRRDHRLPRRAVPGAAELGQEGLPAPHLLQRGRQGRALRGLGAAGDLQQRGA